MTRECVGSYLYRHCTACNTGKAGWEAGLGRLATSPASLLVAGSEIAYLPVYNMMQQSYSKTLYLVILQYLMRLGRQAMSWQCEREGSLQL